MQVLSRSVGGLRSKTIRERTGLARSRTGALPGPHGRRYEPGGAAAAETGLRLPSTSALRLDPLAATGPTRACSRRAGCTGYAARGALPCSRRAPVAAELDTPAGGALPRQGLGGALLSALPARGILARAAAHTGPGRRPPPPARGLAGPCGGRPRSKAPPTRQQPGPACETPAFFPRAQPPPSRQQPAPLAAARAPRRGPYPAVQDDPASESSRRSLRPQLSHQRHRNQPGLVFLTLSAHCAGRAGPRKAAASASLTRVRAACGAEARCRAGRTLAAVYSGIFAAGSPGWPNPGCRWISLARSRPRPAQAAVIYGYGSAAAWAARRPSASGGRGGRRRPAVFSVTREPDSDHIPVTDVIRT